jgi:regulation of enolase protein 1 (concanavalin A-like superfamily)
MPIEYEDHVRRRRSDVFVNRQNWSDWSMTPLQHQVGIVTPNGLFFERHHNGVGASIRMSIAWSSTDSSTSRCSSPWTT